MFTQTHTRVYISLFRITIKPQRLFQHEHLKWSNITVCDKSWLFRVIFGWLWMIVGGFLGGCGSLWVVVDGYGWLWVFVGGFGWLWMVVGGSI